MRDVRILADSELDLVVGAGGNVRRRGGNARANARGGDALAVSAAVIFVGGNSTGNLTATSGAATATGGAGGTATATGGNA
jgi:hypothetical protein